MKIFISHIIEEGQLAKVLKKWIESVFGINNEVFVSSDPDNIPAGSDWFDKISEALNTSKAFLVLCSPNSLLRPWINFETGCGYIKNVTIIPICHSGLTIDRLPLPISRFQALEINNKNFLPDLFKSLAKNLDSNIDNLLNIPYLKIRREINHAIKCLDQDIIRSGFQYIYKEKLTWTKAISMLKQVRNDCKIYDTSTFENIENYENMFKKTIENNASALSHKYC